MLDKRRVVRAAGGPFGIPLFVGIAIAALYEEEWISGTFVVVEAGEQRCGHVTNGFISGCEQRCDDTSSHHTRIMALSVRCNIQSDLLLSSAAVLVLVELQNLAGFTIALYAAVVSV